MVASPSPAKAKVLRVQIVPVSSTLLLIVVITDAGNVAQHTLALSPQPTDITLADVGSVVNEACLGLTFAQAAERVRSLKSSRRESVALLEGLAQVFEAMGDDERSSELYMAGASHLAHRRDIADMAPLFDALEEQIVLMKLMSALSEDTDAYGVGVAIGSETHTPELLRTARWSPAATETRRHPGRNRRNRTRDMKTAVDPRLAARRMPIRLRPAWRGSSA